MADDSRPNGGSRLDRIEAILDGMAARQTDWERRQGDWERRQAAFEERQEAWEADHRRLLTSQVLLQDEMRKFGAGSEERFAKIEMTLAEVSDKLNGVIDLMDPHIREHGQHPE
jgi:hypothetical protein